INCLEWEKNLLIFLRKGKRQDDTLLVVCNFSGQEYEKFQIGVPYPGKYKEILNSDDLAYGGTGFVNPRVKISRQVEWDDRKDSITVNIAPLSVAVFAYTKAVEKLVDNKNAKRKAGKATAAKKKDLKKELQEKIEKEEKRKG
ncbi:MAG TPA: alpha amylase C-terminal domain-containing protein, partial [Candidatus Pelethocola excrementipullorum]|nr:alpha amylase C-terminal domain-containing protein [Candidatus Pelethocola excrementipullorum]